MTKKYLEQDAKTTLEKFRLCPVGNKYNDYRAFLYYRLKQLLKELETKLKEQ